MLKIWGRANSSNVQKVLWTCEEIGIAFERIDAGGAFGKTKEAAYLALNPNGKVPTLVDGDTVVWESNTILRYLSYAYSDGRFYSPDPRIRTLSGRWMDWQLGTLNIPYLGIFREAKKPAAERAASWDADAKELKALLEILDKSIAGGPWITGAEMSLADFALGPIIHRCLDFPIDLPELAALRAWREKIAARPAFQKATR